MATQEENGLQGTSCGSNGRVSTAPGHVSRGCSHVQKTVRRGRGGVEKGRSRGCSHVQKEGAEVAHMCKRRSPTSLR
eukprot:364904-Chlamydomonas_euryale.AAC.24